MRLHASLLLLALLLCAAPASGAWLRRPRCRRSYRAAARRCPPGGVPVRCVRPWWRRRRRRRLGWRCVVPTTPLPSPPPFPPPQNTALPPPPPLPLPGPSTSASPTATPSATPSPSRTATPSPPVPGGPAILPGATPLPAAAYIAATVLRDGPATSDARVVAAPDGRRYALRYNVAFRTAGVVSLQAVADALTVSCTPGAVRVRVAPAQAALLPPLAQMYPVGAVLVVSRDAFGACNLLPPTPTPSLATPDAEQEDIGVGDARATFQQSQDAFLLIAAASGTGADTLLTGSPVSYLAILDRAEISIRDTDAIPLLPGGPTARASDQQRNSSDYTTDVSLPDLAGRAISTKIEWEAFKRGRASVKLAGELTLGGRLESATFSLSGTQVSASVSILREAMVKFSVTAEFSEDIAISRLSFERRLLSGLLYGIPGLDFARRLRIGRLKLPDFRIGVYYELYGVLKATVGPKISVTGDLVYSTGTTRHTFSLSGSVFSPTLNPVQTSTVVQGTRRGSFRPFQPGASGSFELSFSLAPGLQPRVLVVIPLFMAYIKVDALLEVKANAKVPAFNPIDNPGALVLFGNCRTCHLVQLDGSFRIANSEIVTFTGIEYTATVFGNQIVIFTVTRRRFPLDVSFALLFARGCFFPEFGDDTEVCGSDCCNNAIGQKCTIESSTEETCRATTVPPSSTSTAISTTSSTVTSTTTTTMSTSTTSTTGTASTTTTATTTSTTGTSTTTTSATTTSTTGTSTTTTSATTTSTTTTSGTTTTQGTTTTSATTTTTSGTTTTVSATTAEVTTTVATTPPPPEEGSESSTYTDPHLRTFDGLQYDCQAIGEFIMSRSNTSNFQLQTRFVGPNTRGTVTKGVVLASRGSPTVQVSVSSITLAPATLSGCPIVMFINGAPQNVSSITSSPSVPVRVSGGRITISLSNSIRLSFRVRRSSFFGCYLEFLNLFLPNSIIAQGGIYGLLGTPNRNVSDEWTTTSGTVLEAPINREERLFAPAYNYCTRNWCIRNSADSLFTYEAGSNHSTFNDCDRPYNVPDLTSVSTELRNLCGNDDACLVDGLAGGVDEGRNALQVQSEVDIATSSSRELRFSPATIAVGATVSIAVSVDVRNQPASSRAGLSGFDLVRVNSDTGVAQSAAIATLVDDGSALSTDITADDGIFTGNIALQSSTAGERFSFRAIALINGERQDNSTLSTTTLTGVRSYSVSSAIGSVGSNASQSVTVASLAGLELVVQFSWPRDFADLDTQTAFNGSSVGYQCGSGNTFLAFSGDNTGNGGVETSIVRLDAARAEGVWSTSTEVRLFAGWFASRGGRGPATLSVALSNTATRQQVSGTGLSRAINPGTQSSCARTPVAVVSVIVQEVITITLSGASN